MRSIMILFLKFMNSYRTRVYSILTTQIQHQALLNSLDFPRPSTTHFRFSPASLTLSEKLMVRPEIRARAQMRTGEVMSVLCVSRAKKFQSLTHLRGFGGFSARRRRRVVGN